METGSYGWLFFVGVKLIRLSREIKPNLWDHQMVKMLSKKISSHENTIVKSKKTKGAFMRGHAQVFPSNDRYSLWECINKRIFFLTHNMWSCWENRWGYGVVMNLFIQPLSNWRAYLRHRSNYLSHVYPNLILIVGKRIEKNLLDLLFNTCWIDIKFQALHSFYTFPRCLKRI